MTGPDEPHLLVTAAQGWDGLRDDCLRPFQVLMRGDRIVETGTRVERPRGTRVLEASGTVLPGLIDCHVHVAAGDGTGGGPASRQALDALPALRTLLSHGFTTVRDLGCPAADPVTVELARAVEAGLIEGPRMLVAPHIISPRGGHGDPRSTLQPPYGGRAAAVADGVDEVVRQVRIERQLGAHWIKFAATGGFVSPADAADTVAYTQEEMTALVAAARDLNLPSAAHAHFDEGVRRAVRAGVRSVEHGTFATDDTLRLMAEHRTTLVPTRWACHLYIDHLDDPRFWAGQPAGARDKVAPVADDILRNARRLLSGQVPVAFGTDAGTVPFEDSWREFVVLVSEGMTPLAALRAATSQAARLLGRADLGVLRPGARGDLVVVAGDPFADIETIGEVAHVVRGGRVRS
ncbi:amidohydrolase family protein [Nonomuraea sp. NPDC049655]|uniref:amidohydrolase family protein n=1 Tax=Nonomuraea sp. NPDC049655 TaxID=3364355 RepID=UPI0037A36208